MLNVTQNGDVYEGAPTPPTICLLRCPAWLPALPACLLCASPAALCRRLLPYVSGPAVEAVLPVAGSALTRSRPLPAVPVDGAHAVIPPQPQGVTWRRLCSRRARLLRNAWVRHALIIGPALPCLSLSIHRCQDRHADVHLHRPDFDLHQPMLVNPASHSLAWRWVAERVLPGPWDA